jgi:hypothetical protein
MRKTGLFLHPVPHIDARIELSFQQLPDGTTDAAVGARRSGVVRKTRAASREEKGVAASVLLLESDLEGVNRPKT